MAASTFQNRKEENELSNVKVYDKLHHRFIVNVEGSVQTPYILLKNRKLSTIGEIYPIEGLKIITSFVDAYECTFTIYKNNNGNINPYWDRIKDLSVILIEGFGLFELSVPETETECVYKTITGKSLQVAELSQCNCTLEINTEADVARTDYDESYPTLFYRDIGHEEASLLHRVLTYAPHYSIGHVDDSLKNLNREFSCNNKTVYDFLQSIAEEIGCIFLFDPYSRTINAFDLEDHCCECGGRHVINGICQECGSSDIEEGYGVNATPYADTYNLLKEITRTGDKDSVKNCFKLVAGDDEVTNRIGQRLIGNSNYIWTFSDDQLVEMSPELREKWKTYGNLIESQQENFNSYWDEYNRLLDDKLMWESNKFPESYTEFASAKEVFEKIKATLTYTYITNKNTVLATVSGNVLDYARLLVSSEYTVEFAKNTDGTNKTDCEYVIEGNNKIITKWKGYLHIYKNNYVDSEGNYLDEYYSPEWVLPVKKGYEDIPDGDTFTNDYYLFLKQKLDYAMLKGDTLYKPKYDTDYPNNTPDTTDQYYYKNFFKGYSVSQLESWYKAYSMCSEIIFEQNNTITDDITRPFYYIVDDSGNISSETIYEALKKKYNAFCDCLEDIIAEYTEYIEADQMAMDHIKKQIDAINDRCNINNYLGDELYQELILFKREDVYENQNFISDVTDETTLMKNVEEFILDAKQEIAKACQLSHSITVDMCNFLTMREYVFSNICDYFSVGNYIKLRIDEKIIKLRVLSVTFDFDNIETLEVTFSDVLEEYNQMQPVKKALAKAESMATSFDYVQKQTTENDQKISTFDKMFEEGLDATNTLIKNADNQTTVIDSHGILTRQWISEENSYSPEAMRITNGAIAYTTDNGETIKSAFGRFYWNGAWRYGLIAPAIVGQMIAGENLTITNGEKTVEINGDGIVLDGGAITWTNPISSDAIDGLNDALGVTTITKDSVLSPKIEGGTIKGSTIEGSEINGGKIEGGELMQSGSNRKITLKNGVLSMNNVHLCNGLLNYYTNQDVYNNAMNIACDDYTAEVGFRWEGDEVHLISNDSLSLGESTYPVKDINMSGTLNVKGEIKGNVIYNSGGTRIVLSDNGIGYSGVIGEGNIPWEVLVEMCQQYMNTKSQTTETE